MEYVGTGPVAPAVSVEDFKRAVSIEQDVSDYDALFASYLAAAADVVATGANRPLSVGAYRFLLPLGAWSRWWFPCAPVVSLVSIEQRDSQGHWSPVPDGAFSLQAEYDEPQLCALNGWQGFDGDVSAARVTVNAGSEVTDPTTLSLRQAVILIAKEWFEAGEEVEAARAKLSFVPRSLIKQKRYQRPWEVD